MLISTEELKEINESFSAKELKHCPHMTQGMHIVIYFR